METADARKRCVHGVPLGMSCSDCLSAPAPPMAGHGCICPPGANLQCENPLCPRKPLDMRATS